MDNIQLLKDNIQLLHYHAALRHRDAHGSTQKAISARIDTQVLNELDQECFCSGVKRNAIINKACHWYLESLDDARRALAHGDTGVDGTMSMSTSHERLLTNRLTCQQLSKLHHICASLNVSVDDLVYRLLDRLLESYDERPTLYL